MQNEIVQFLFQYLFIVFACFAFYFLGFFLLRIFSGDIGFRNAKWFHAYFSIVLGIVVTVFIYSMILSKGKTINILFLPFFIGVFFARKNKVIAGNWRSNFRAWPIIFLVIIPFLFVVLFHLFPESEYKQIDAQHYLQISQSFNDIGQENNFGANGLLEKHYGGNIPYHYFEFWLNAILLKCFPALLPNIQILRFVCYGVICVGGLLGLFALAELIIKSPLSFIQMLLCICFVFYIPNFLEYIGFLKPVFIFPFENNMLERPNLRTLYLFLPGILISIENNRNKWQNLFWTLCIIISSVLNFVVFLVAIPIFCLIMFKRRTTEKYSFFMLPCVFLVALLYFLFYYLTSVSTKITPIGIKEDALAYCIKYWKLILFSTASSILYCLFMPLVMLYCIRKYKKKLFIVVLQAHYRIILFACTIIFCAVIIARVLNFMDDSYQFAFLGYTLGAFLLFIILLITSSVIKIKNWIYGIVCVFFLMSFLIMRFLFHPNKYKNVFIQNGSYIYGGRNYSNDYLTNTLAVFSPNSKVNGAFWADAKFYDTIPYYSSRNPTLYGLPIRYILAYKLKFNYEVCLSDSASIMYGIDTSQKARYNYLRSAILRSMFYQYETIENINQKRLSFIKQYKLQYLILTKNADTSIISNLPIIKYFQDSNTGERFYVIDNNRF